MYPVGPSSGQNPAASPMVHPVSGFWQYENATVSTLMDSLLRMATQNNPNGWLVAGADGFEHAGRDSTSTSLIPAHPHLKLKLTNSRELWNFRTATESPHLDHFFQCVLRNMKGAGEPTWDYEDALGDDIRPSRSRLPAEIRLEKHNKTVIPNSERVSHGNPGIPPHWKPEIKHNTLSRTLRPPSIEHIDYNSGGRTLHGNHGIVLQRVLVTPAYWLCMSNCGLAALANAQPCLWCWSQLAGGKPPGPPGTHV
ncbi:uncharacterized protein LACBIDRAFT_333611 [Laccaria bicolor S238N-H82]|uniref:Predicted protein n=1 Tax=Laccaria bicolor (strain S238N-H82 / ATCC MYA-4686) TaxID=486041 RepID=B0DWH9_LACBS|nr:uncharacterized protein LACBIDRAFT_333611 [Laccaria bicolor S238N-H82]EDR01049.1 predicted protein [Laccaria bicolor S238N-H82]|eukprot:XP_001888268.1 predicted protein [Laccaria bicolor S238N-H82]